PTDSIDSIWSDSVSTSVKLFIGEEYKLDHINTGALDKRMLELAGWSEKNLADKPLNITRLEQLKESLLAYFDENGYPFAKVQIDSLHFENNQLTASLKIDKGPQYKIDSLRIFGDAKINNVFLQRYLDIKNGSYYQKSKLQNINKRLLELPYI
ncbi:MAG: hypothetical protein ABUT20_59845, partial [Bacteroidota bacterium]